MISVEQLIILCGVGWFFAIAPLLYNMFDLLRNRIIMSRGYSQVSPTDDLEIPQDEDEMSVLKHFRNSVS